MRREMNDEQASGGAEEKSPESNVAHQEDELEAEQESAEAMDAEVPQPAGADRTTEGQPS